MLDRRGIKSHVDRHLSEAREMMQPRVRKAFEKLLQEHSFLTPDPAPYFGPLGPPLFELPGWVAIRLSEEGAEISEDALTDVLGASALGYLHIRAQDDWFDAASREDPTLVVLAETLIAQSNRLLISVVGPSTRFWQFYVEVLNAYSESFMREEALRKGEVLASRSTFEQLLAQVRPLVLPSAALLDRADRWQYRHPLDEFVFTTTAVSQIFNDMMDLYRDRRMGQRTWTLEVIGESEVDGLWSEVAGAPSGEGSGWIQERIGEALSFHERSTRAARALALTAAEAWLADRRVMLEGLLDSLHGSLLTSFVRRMSKSAAGL